MFDIPLLYETQAEQQLDVVLVVSAPAEVQQQRVLARPGMTPEKLAAILARQVEQASGTSSQHPLGIVCGLCVLFMLAETECNHQCPAQHEMVVQGPGTAELEV